MLLEYKNPSTRKYFDPNIDYVEFENGPDLVEKINYYISHPQEAEKIAENGHAKYNSNYSAFHFWKKIMDRIESEL
jgi:spore maturation protein CgeB